MRTRSASRLCFRMKPQHLPPTMRHRAVHTGVHHVAFEYDTVDDLLDTWVRLSGEGTLPHMSLDHGLTLSFYSVDPDGNSVELQADWYGDWAKSSDFVRT